MIKLGFVLLIAVILVQGMLFWKYQRQVKDICRQLSFLMKHDSNMLITREMDFGGIGELADVLNEWLELKRREKKEYLKKEEYGDCGGFEQQRVQHDDCYLPVHEYHDCLIRSDQSFDPEGRCGEFPDFEIYSDRKDCTFIHVTDQ